LEEPDPDPDVGEDSILRKSNDIDDMTLPRANRVSLVFSHFLKFLIFAVVHKNEEKDKQPQKFFKYEDVMKKGKLQIFFQYEAYFP